MGYGNCGTGGGSSASREKQMAAYDSLPRAARTALADAYENWAAYPINKWWQQGRFKTANDLVKMIADWDAQDRKADRKRLDKYLSRNDPAPKRPARSRRTR